MMSYFIIPTILRIRRICRLLPFHLLMGRQREFIMLKMLKDMEWKIYNPNGQLVGTSIEGLPKGVYVINGQKVIIK